MGFWEKVLMWFKALGELLYDFTKTQTAALMREHGPRAKEIVIECAREAGLSGKEKFGKAVAMLLAEAPGMALSSAETIIQVAYSVFKDSDFYKDTDGDGIPDWRDVCKELGTPEGGCVTDDGCPDSDCDGIPDSEDPCPEDPDPDCQ